MGVVRDANRSFGRNQAKDQLQAVAAKLDISPDADVADLPTESGEPLLRCLQHLLPGRRLQLRRSCAGLREALGQPQAEGKAPAFRLTSHQSSIVRRLIERHGNDVEVRRSEKLLCAAAVLC